jgi:aldehyde dehydrogenase (NAD+)
VTMDRAVGTAGQRCTTLRRLLLHKDIYDRFLEMLLQVAGGVDIRVGEVDH